MSMWGYEHRGKSSNQASVHRGVHLPLARRTLSPEDVIVTIRKKNTRSVLEKSGRTYCSPRSHNVHRAAINNSSKVVRDQSLPHERRRTGNIPRAIACIYTMPFKLPPVQIMVPHTAEVQLHDILRRYMQVERLLRDYPRTECRVDKCGFDGGLRELRNLGFDREAEAEDPVEGAVEELGRQVVDGREILPVRGERYAG